MKRPRVPPAPVADLWTGRLRGCMDSREGIRPEQINNALCELVEGFDLDLAESHEAYAETMAQLATLINQLGRGALKGIDEAELRSQTGPLLRYIIKDIGMPVPFDISYLHLIKSHFRNPTILVLRRIRKFLVSPQRKILAQLEEDQHRERQIQFRNLDIDRKVKTNLEEMQRFQTMAQLTRSVSRKLDILARAVCVPRQSKLEFRLLNGILDDVHHLRHTNALQWLTESVSRGDVGVMNRVIEKGMWVLDRKSEKLREELERLSGLPLADNQTLVEAGNWYALITPVRRGQEFLSIFDAEEQVETRIKKVTFFIIQSAYHEGKFHTLLDQITAARAPAETYVAEVSALYFELERCIEESAKANGEAHAAIASDLKFGLLSAKEADEATAWLAQNRLKLQSLKMEVFGLLFEYRKANPQTALPQAIEDRIESERNLLDEQPGDALLGDVLPKIPVKALEAELEQLQAEAVHLDATLLEPLCDFHAKVVAWRVLLAGQSYHRKLRDISEDFDEFERNLMRFNQLEEALENLRATTEVLVERVYHGVYLGQIPQATLDRAFRIVIDLILFKVRMLEYEVLDAERYQRIFERALDYQGQAAYSQLDQLFKELHALPRQAQLNQALSEWEGELDKDSLAEKQNFIVENEFHLQELLDQVRAELRERMTQHPLESRRLRFDVFSLGDCYAPNLETALEAQLRLLPKLASDQQGESLIEHLQALEYQVLEAQRVTRPQGEALRKLRDLERSRLLPTTFLGDLRQDLEANFADLDHLLERINRELRNLRKLQNRFGGKHDDSVFSLAINYHDLEQLKKIYNFVENITMIDLKRFGLVYNHKNAMMEDLLKRALARDPSVPPNVAAQVNRRIFKAFSESKNIPLELKILILWEQPEILESEAELLLRTLNFVDHAHIAKKSIYQGLLQVLGKCKSAEPTTLTHLKRIWSYNLTRVNGFRPPHYQKNYELNRRKLVADAQQEIGSTFK